MIRNSKKYRQDKKILLTVAALILCAVVCRLFSRFDVVDDVLNYLCSLLRSIIYMGIIITWGVSVRRRVLNRSVRRYLMAIAALLLFWFGIRTCKFLFLEGIPSDGDLSCMLSWKTGKLHVADSIKGDYRSGDPVYFTDPYQ